MTFASCSHCYHLTFFNLTKMLMLAFSWTLFKQGLYIFAWLKPCLGLQICDFDLVSMPHKGVRNKLQIVFSDSLFFFSFLVSSFSSGFTLECESGGLFLLFSVNLFPSTPSANINPKHKLCNINCIYQTVKHKLCTY